MNFCFKLHRHRLYHARSPLCGCQCVLRVIAPIGMEARDCFSSLSKRNPRRHFGFDIAGSTRISNKTNLSRLFSFSNTSLNAAGGLLPTQTDGYCTTRGQSAATSLQHCDLFGTVAGFILQTVRSSSFIFDGRHSVRFAIMGHFWLAGRDPQAPFWGPSGL